MEHLLSRLDVAFWLTAGAILCLLLLSAFFAASETALTAASRARLRAGADRGEPGAQAAIDAVDHPEKLIGVVVFGNTVVTILSAALATGIGMRLFGAAGIAWATLAMTVLVLVFAQVLPRTYAIAWPETVAPRVARPVLGLIRILSPVVAAVRWVARGILRIFGLRISADQTMFSFKDEIADAIAIGTSEGTLDKEDRDRILGALDLDNRTVAEVMRHRSQIEMLDIDLPADDLLAAVLHSPHTRLPLYRGERENVVGVIHAKDLLRAVNRALREAEGDRESLAQIDMMKVAMKPYFIPETTPLNEQMREFLKRRMHFALVVDEYGDLRGLVTLEDIIEEIVGDITDEMDLKTVRQVRGTAQDGYTVDGVTTIRDLNREMDWALPDVDANTIAGLVIHEAQTIPEPGQVFAFHGFRFEVLGRKGNRIEQLKIVPLQPAADEA